MVLSRGTYFHRSYTTIDGVRRQKWVRLSHDYGKAVRKYAEIEAAREAGARNMRALFAAYLASSQYAEKAPKTRQNYRLYIGRLSETFGDLMPDEIEQQHATGIMDRVQQRVTAQRMVQIFSTVLGWGAARGWLKANPLFGFKKGERAVRKRYITDDELTAILTHADPITAAFIRFDYLTALRANDALRLRWGDVKDDGIHAYVQKTKQSVLLTWTPDLRAREAECKSLRAPVASMWLFPARPGQRVTLNTMWRRFKRAAKAAGVTNVTIHDLRRKRLTDLQLDESVDVAAKVAVHSDTRTTKGYFAAPEIIVALPPVERRASGVQNGN